MKERSWLLMGCAIIAVTFPVYASHEKSVEAATGNTCEELLAITTTQFGSLVQVEHAIAFAFEEQYYIYIARIGNDDSPELNERSAKNRDTLARLSAVHSLIQNPRCPMQEGWYRSELKIFTEDNWWFMDYKREERS